MHFFNDLTPERGWDWIRGWECVVRLALIILISILSVPVKADLLDRDGDGVEDSQDSSIVTVAVSFPNVSISIERTDLADNETIVWSDLRLFSPSGCRIVPSTESGQGNKATIDWTASNFLPSGTYTVGGDTPRVGLNTGEQLYDQSQYPFEISNPNGSESVLSLQKWSLNPITEGDQNSFQFEAVINGAVDGLARAYPPPSQDQRLKVRIHLVFDDWEGYIGFGFSPNNVTHLGGDNYKISLTGNLPEAVSPNSARVNRFDFCDGALNFFQEVGDADGDGALDAFDAFPENANEFKDTDSDSVGDNEDAFLTDPAASVDSDGDGAPDDWNEGATEEQIASSSLVLDAFPNDASETSDTDGDGIGDNADIDSYIDSIADANLRTCVLDEGKELVSDLTELKCPYSEISKLSGIQAFTNLTFIQLGGNQVADFSALSDLDQIVTLYIGANPIQSTEFVTSLVGLADLDIGGFTGDKAPLEALTSLERLVVTVGDAVNDTEVLQQLTSLRTLSIGAANLNDLHFLSSMTDLDSLRLYGASNADWTTLPAITSLRLLEAAHAQIEDISAFAGLTSVETLFLGSNSIKDITPLADIHSLDRLDLAANVIQRLDSAPIIVPGGQVNLSGNPIECSQLSSYKSRLTDVTVLFDESTCIPDRDFDGVLDDEDAFPDDSSETTDTDRDGIGNNADTDDDGDGYSDEVELSMGSDPLDPSSVPEEEPSGLPVWLMYLISRP